MIDEALDHLVEKTPELGGDARGLASITGQRAFAKAARGETREVPRMALKTASNRTSRAAA